MDVLSLTEAAYGYAAALDAAHAFDDQHPAHETVDAGLYGLVITDRGDGWQLTLALTANHAAVTTLSWCPANRMWLVLDPLPDAETRP